MTQREKRKIDTVINDFDTAHRDSINRSIQWICIPMLTLGLMGLVWSIPFPHLNFLGNYNGFINWASFLIALTMYYYYKLSPLLSYGILLVLFAFSALIVSFEKLHLTNNWPSEGTVCLMIFVAGLILQFIGLKKEKAVVTLARQLTFLLNGPLWLIYNLFQKIGIKG
jgi:uncharacterized membrane protein YGL010W